MVCGGAGVDADLALVLGLVVAVLMVPSILSAVVDGRGPRVPVVTLLIAGALVLYALWIKPGGYQLSTLPDVFVRVVAQFLP